MTLWMAGVPRQECPDPGTPIAVQAGVVHKTIGRWPGDRDYVCANSLAHFTVGPDQDQWAQHAPADVFLPHCNGANRRAVGIEFSDLDPNGPLTAWQAEAWTRIRAWLEPQVADTYLDPDSAPRASVWVNGGGFDGWISHYSVRTDDGSVQHTDSVPFSSYHAGDDMTDDQAKQLDELHTWLIGEPKFLGASVPSLYKLTADVHAVVVTGYDFLGKPVKSLIGQIKDLIKPV